MLAKYAPKLLIGSGSRISAFEESIVSPQLISFDGHPADIIIKTSNKPLVSVIISIYGKIEYTLNCLASIAANPPKLPFEIIVVDDYSPGNSAEVLENLKGVRLVRNEQNQGFIRSSNTGASVARGKYLYFLNNDTQVTPGWMDELVRTFHEFPGTGLVGSKLIYPDGRLQEAGGIIWQDGSAWNFGKFQNPMLPIYNYAREVDYCSGASIMVPKSLFDESGGFDEHYLPAYCEDSDLALRIRDNGHRVIYQPLSTIIHYEGITSGKDTSNGVKAYQVDNSKKLYTRWKERLSTHQSPGIDIDKAKDRRAKYRALVLEHCTPTPNQDAGSVTVFNLLLLLREMDFQVTFIPADDFLYMPEYTTALQRIGVEMLYAPYVTSVEQHLKEYGERYDLAFLFRPGVVERNIRAVRKYCPQAKVLYYSHDLHFLRMSREAGLLQDPRKAKLADQMKTRELSVINACDAAIVVSEQELNAIRDKVSNDKLHILPLILNTPGTKKGFSERKDIVFVGGFQHTPNSDAVKYFVTEIMPLLRRDIPGIRFYVVGSNLPEDINALRSDDVIITGFVDDLIPLLDRMRVSVAPLRYGAGVKGKVGTAMAAGLPVVATNVAAEGMSLSDGDNVLIADDPDDFAKAVKRLYRDEGLWGAISEKGLDFASENWGAESAWKTLSNILNGLEICTHRGKQALSLYSQCDSRKAEIKRYPEKLTPIAVIENHDQYTSIMESGLLDSIKVIEKRLLKSANSETFQVKGFCAPCNKEVSFLVDMKFGGRRNGNGWIPNWRERLECPECGLNNRQRLIATLVKQALNGKRNNNVYFMEQITPIFKWATQALVEHNVIGSEYLGFGCKSGEIENGIRHEDVQNLSFPVDKFEIIVSNDVFEHVPDPAKAFRECARVLKPGGLMMATIPFHSDKFDSVSRARLNDGEIEYSLPPIYHGNPVSEEGALVFSDFGWDILNEMKLAGFSKVAVSIYASERLGHLGSGQIVFEARRRTI